MTQTEKRKLCEGCCNDFYNGKNDVGIKQCWSLKTAEVVTRYRIGWWTTPTTPGAFTKCKTLSCHNATGRYALYEKLPDFAKDVRDET